MKKPKITSGKAATQVKLGASASSKPPNPLVGLMKSTPKDYKKTEQEQYNVSFGQTGLTGES
jgi:hypothetical protein